jgi:hypothetical protein
MSSSAAAGGETSLFDEEDQVLRWRTEQFRQLGFSETEADELAQSEADLGRARYLRASDCSPGLAFQILN